MTLAIASEATKLAAAGVDVVSLGTGEPDFATPEVVKEAAIHAIRDNWTHYTHASGILPLRQAVVEKFAHDNAIRTDPERVIISNGGKHALHTALMAIISDGDEVLIPSPYWTSYPDLVHLAGGSPVIVRTEPGERYKIDPDRLEHAYSPRTRALILNSPSNPTGVMYTPSEIREIGLWAASRGLFVISDELYEKIVYDENVHVSIGSMEELENLAITINGVSKAFAMTGWRIGYMTGPKDIMAAAARIQSQATSNPCSISQMAALAALTKVTTEVDQMVSAFARRRGLMVSRASQIHGVTAPTPDGAFYLLMDTSRYLNTDVCDDLTLARHLLYNHGVAVVPGSAFGANGAIRLSYACSDDVIIEGLARIDQGLREFTGSSYETTGSSL